MTLTNTPLPHQFQGVDAKGQQRPSQVIAPNANVAMDQAKPESDPQGLGKGLLGGKSAREKARLLLQLMKLGLLGVREDPADEPFSKPFQALLHAVYLDDVDTHTVDHGRASRMSRFISLTASPRPVRTALATIACPILSSLITGIAAMGITFW